MKSQCRLCLFDLDGVIIDSRKNMEKSWAAVQAVFDIKVPFDQYFEQVGRPFDEIMEIIGLHKLAQPIKKVYDTASACRLDMIEPYEGCIETIQSIKKQGKRIGVVTSKSQDRTLEIIKQFGVLFDVIECPNGRGRGKPNPDPILRAIIKCQSDPAETIYVGDMEVDYEAAKRAGVRYIHVEWGYGEYDHEMIRIAKPDELLKHI